ncbi:SpoIIE family protein phosphatase [Streptomyces sp. VNUA24]|uniref:ATP-binding SpoIIE family protein phosphatase n=1 Tax=Streptomyces sp. VNUA24 TaxID=3031131 RepID=UPI0023B7FDD8|nr:SpoIIE family protein phosphatase [Streptomyces sp. VNUA24]WEH13076.1 SpoIIE family protein phosphatase [Streptomyces sp. VNUA24]
MRSPRADERSYAFDGLAVAILDPVGVILRWTDSAEELTGLTTEEVCGRPVCDLMADHPKRDAPRIEGSAGVPASGRVRLRQRSGAAIEVEFRTTALDGSTDLMVLAVPVHRSAVQSRGVALLRALSSQSLIGIALHDTDLAIVHTNGTAGLFGGPSVMLGSRLQDVLAPVAAKEIESTLRQVLNTGTPTLRGEQWVSLKADPTRQWGLSLSAFRLEDPRGRPTGVAVMFEDNTEQLLSRRRLRLSHEAALRFGGSLNVVHTAQELADVLAPALGDVAGVELAQGVLEGDDPPKGLGGGNLHMFHAALAPADVGSGAQIAPGDPIPPVPDSPLLRNLQQGRTTVLDRTGLMAMLDDPALAEFLLPPSFHSVMFAPLWARGFLLGDVTVWRINRSDAFTQEDADLLTEVASRAALAIDNARRYTREHRAAVVLQEHLLPPATTDTPAAETAGAYLPAGDGAEIGGDWFDALALPSLRLALVVGDVVGHGMHATAGMGRLRAAIRTLADLELEPDELLARMADLVQRLAAEAPSAEQDAVGATCLFAVYDPVTRRCVMASAGHPPPIVLRPDGVARIVEISAGPPLSVGGVPYETATIELEPDSVIALYTDGVIERDSQDLDDGLRRLTDSLATSCRSPCDLATVGREILADLADGARHDDMALLLARIHAVPADSTVDWEFRPDPSVVAEARKLTMRQLNVWGLDDLAFTTELVVSELVTNAIRYANASVGLRLIRHDVLICEVTDASSTQPRLRHARTTDEGGRGLFLVAQLTTRWGCRYGLDGKTIWAEQPIKGTAKLVTPSRY